MRDPHILRGRALKVSRPAAAPSGISIDAAGDRGAEEARLGRRPGRLWSKCELTAVRGELVIERGDAAAASEILALVPPSALEACEVPLWEVSRMARRRDRSDRYR